MEDRYCAYCFCRIFPEDRYCDRCGAPTKSAFSKSKENDNQPPTTRNFKNVSSYADVRVISQGDSQYFSISERDIFAKLETRRETAQAEIVHQFEGVVPIIPNSDTIPLSYISYLFLSAIETIDTAPNMRFNASSQKDIVQAFQTVSAWNRGIKPVIVGTARAIHSVLPPDKEYRYNIEHNGINFFEFIGCGGLILPDHHPVKFFGSVDDRIWIVSPTNGKLLKLVYTDTDFTRVGVGVGFSSIAATLFV